MDEVGGKKNNTFSNIKVKVFLKNGQDVKRKPLKKLHKCKYEYDSLTYWHKVILDMLTYH